MTIRTHHSKFMFRNNSGARNLRGDRKRIHSLNAAKRAFRRQAPQTRFIADVPGQSASGLTQREEDLVRRLTNNGEPNCTLHVAPTNRNCIRATPDRNLMMLTRYIIPCDSSLLRFRTNSPRRGSIQLPARPFRSLYISSSLVNAKVRRGF